MMALAYPEPPLDDGRVHLRPWREDDVAAIVAAVDDPAIRRWSHLPEPFDVAAARARLARMATDVEAGRALRLLIADAADHRQVLGAIALFDHDASRHTAHTGYWIAAHARGRGLATRALGLLMAWAAAELGLRRLFARPDQDNEVSQRVLEHCGFSQSRRAGELLYVAELGV